MEYMFDIKYIPLLFSNTTITFHDYIIVKLHLISVPIFFFYSFICPIIFFLNFKLILITNYIHLFINNVV